MALIRILVKEGLTGSFYVKNGADFRKSSLIDPAQDKMAIFGHIMVKFGQIWVLITILGEDNFTTQFYVTRVAIPEKAVLLTH